MKIAINAIPYTRWSGIEVFLFNLLENWPINEHDEVIVFVNNKSSKIFSSLPDCIKIRQIKINSTNRLQLFLYQQVVLPIILKKEEFDLIFCASLISPWLFSKKIITIHDAAPFVLKDENSFFGKVFWRVNLFFSLLSTLKIITVSKFSKKELINKLKINESKIEIIYNGSPSINKDYKKIDDDKNYLVAVGNARPRKNLEILFLAFNNIKNKNIKLKIIGKMDDRMKVLKENYGSARIEFTGFINDQEKYELISNAKALVFPSLYEGFGIPILEAGILNTPLICSDIPSFREVARDSAIYFNPKNHNDLKEKIDYILDNDEIISNYRKKGLVNAQRYNWLESSKKLSNIIHRYENTTSK